MSLVTKENAKVNTTVFSCYYDAPFDSSGYTKGTIREVFDDHFLYSDDINHIDSVWGFYDTDVENDTVVVFTTEDEAKAWVEKQCARYNYTR